jgi:hypothetical protein
VLTVQADQPFIIVNPPSGCGTGSFTVSLQDTQHGVLGVGFSTLTISFRRDELAAVRARRSESR